MRTRVCQSMCGKGPVLIWPSGKTGEEEEEGEEGGKKGGMTEERHTWGRGRVRGEEGGRRDVHYCSTVEGGAHTESKNV